MKNILSFIALMSTVVLFAQEYSFKEYHWDEKQTKVAIPEQYKNENEVLLDRTQKVEFVMVGQAARQYRLIHEKKYINSDDAIERNNKIYIPFNEGESVVTNKVRVILKSGKVYTLDNKDIKEETDEEKGMKYKYFALNGLEKGAVIEKIFILQENPEINGVSYKMQAEYPIANLSFELIVPKHLVFKTKSYNGLSEPVIDTEKVPNKSVITITEKNIPALHDDETYSNWDTHLKLFRYKLESNTITGAKNLYNFKEFATNFYDRVNPEYDKKQQKSIDEFCKNIPKSNDTQEQIWNIENKIKKTIAYNKYIETKEYIADVIKTKQANEFDIIRLYAAVFKNFQIENSIVFTSNRYKTIFDKDFETYENLSEILMYFPAIKQYISPTNVEYRVPLFPFNLANNNGLFIKSKQFAGVAMGIGEINFIGIPGSDITSDTMNITVDFTKDIENPTVTNNMTFGGYAALNFQPIKDFVSAEEYKKILKSIAENYTVQTEYKTLTTGNDGIGFIGKKPFELNVVFEGKDLMQKAGESYLFSIGQIIGKQTELYQEGKRILPIEIQYPHHYLRKIKIILPKGATVKNLDKFNMDFKTLIDGKPQAVFNSKYDKTENIISVENTESYELVNYPYESFDQYKGVINAAADFNKIVIIITR